MMRQRVLIKNRREKVRKEEGSHDMHNWNFPSKKIFVYKITIKIADHTDALWCRNKNKKNNKGLLIKKNSSTALCAIIIDLLIWHRAVVDFDKK